MMLVCMSLRLSEIPNAQISFPPVEIYNIKLHFSEKFESIPANLLWSRFVQELEFLNINEG